MYAIAIYIESTSRLHSITVITLWTDRLRSRIQYSSTSCLLFQIIHIFCTYLPSILQCRQTLFTVLHLQNVPFHKEGGPHQRPVVSARSQLHIRAAPRSKHHGRHSWSSGSCVPLRRTSTSRCIQPVRKSERHLTPGCMAFLHIL